MAVNQSFSVAKASQSITFGALAAKTYGAAPFTVSATASSGLAVSFASLTTPVCTVSGSTVTLIAVGTCTIRASQAGNATYAAAPNVDQSFSVNAALITQTITFGALSGQTFGAAPFTVSATASSGLSVSFASLTTPVCTVSGSTVTLVGAGTCTIQASQAGNATYAAAPSVSQSLAVAKAAQTIIFGALTDKTQGAAPFTIGATASSGLAVSFASLHHAGLYRERLDGDADRRGHLHHSGGASRQWQLPRCSERQPGLHRYRVDSADHYLYRVGQSDPGRGALCSCRHGILGPAGKLRVTTTPVCTISGVRYLDRRRYVHHSRITGRERHLRGGAQRRSGFHRHFG